MAVQCTGTLKSLLSSIQMFNFSYRKYKKYVISHEGVENIPVYPDLPRDVNGNADVSTQDSRLLSDI